MNKSTSAKKMKKIRDAVNRLWKGKPVRNCSCGKSKGASNMKSKNRKRSKVANASKKSFIDRLIGDGDGIWKEKDRDMLKGLNASQLSTLVQKDGVATKNARKEKLRQRKLANKRLRAALLNARDEDEDRKKKKKKGVKSKDKSTKNRAMSMKEFIASAPKGLRNSLSMLDDMRKDTRKRLYKIILANKSNHFTKDELRVMEDQELHKMAALANSEDHGENETQRGFNFFGQQGIVNNRKEDDDFETLELPPSTMRNQGKAKKSRR